MPQSEHARAMQRAKDIRKDIAQHVSTRGDAFAMDYEGRSITDRRLAGTMLLSKVRLAERGRKPLETVLALARRLSAPLHRRPKLAQRIRGEPCSRAQRPRSDRRRRGRPHAPWGLISRLEYLLDRLEFDLQEQERRAQEADNRRAGYEERAGQAFPLQAELDAKLATLAALDADLAQTAKKAA